MPSMLSYINHADSAAEVTVTNDREVAGLGMRNIFTEPVAEVWRIPQLTGGAGTNLILTWAEPVEIGVIALFAPRDSYMPADYEVRATASIVSTTGTDVLNTGFEQLDLAANRGAWWHFPAAPITAQYLWLRFVEGTDAEYLQLGRLWVGPTIRPAHGAAQDGYRRGYADSGVVERAAISGVPSASAGRVYRAPRWVLPMLSDDEADSIEAAAEACGTTRQLLTNARTQRGAKDLVLGRFAALPDPQAIAPLEYTAEIAILEDV